jgi:membrane-associated phospholipid phosphatase
MQRRRVELQLGYEAVEVVHRGGGDVFQVLILAKSWLTMKRSRPEDASAEDGSSLNGGVPSSHAATAASASAAAPRRRDFVRRAVPFGTRMAVQRLVVDLVFGPMS